MGLFSPKRNPEPPKAAPEPEKPVAEPALTKADIQAMIEGASAATAQTLGNVINDLKSGIDRLATPPVVVQQHQPVYEPAITDDDIDNAVASGQGSRQIRALLDRQARDLKAGFDRQFNELAEFGVNAIANLTAETLKQLPHYARFKKDIDQKLNALTPAMRANPDTLRLIYNSVVGEHSDELSREAHEKALRQAAEGDTGGTKPVNEIDVRGGSKPGSGGSGAGRGDAKVPSVEEFAGPGALVSLKEKDARSGRDADAFAQSMGYKDWNHYISQYEALRAEQGDNF